ncbi:hypothetical protein BU24DRAFT_456916 [Aaosphaeria arxii CBS 175.79]|uniref:Nuclear membrane fusion protein Kar5 n=1 Tax=Aaosphaeria arxii CBS 175.79 TaxID=1450172 RepID=A0A6A5Y7W0_9PLEO|nr:uncharacterized protein BU24DRAFT_456916 [Aaosphaeria arxii CBS 175.79]KAF2020890.1 hypothetical protein BU24DRAFT_456916 [Aaosphaeria arxii CBS 175.79]
MAHDAPTINTDLASVLRTPRQEQEVISEALRIIQHMESAPDCNRLAALSLINDCKSLEDGPNETKRAFPNILDEVKSEYAARLAVCELVGARAKVSRDCLILVPSAAACDEGGLFSFGRRKRSQASAGELCYPKATQAKFESCLKALADNAQSWTSYSNSRQNAVVMCRASRDSIEREKTLAIYKSLAEVVADLTGAYEETSRNLQHAMETWLDEQHKFADKIRMSQENVRNEMQANRDMTRQSFADLSHQAKELRQYLAGYEVSIKHFQQFMKEVFHNISESSSQQTTNQQHELQVYHQNAIAGLQESIDTFMRGLTTLSSSIGMVRDEAELTHKTLVTVNEGLMLVDTELKVIKADTEKIHTAIEESKETFKILSLIGSFVVNPKWLMMAAMVLGSFLYGTWRLSKRIAGLTLMLGGTCHFLYRVGILHSAQDVILQAKVFITHQGLTILLAVGAVGLLSISTVLWSWSQNAYLYMLEDEQGTTAILPRVEDPGLPSIAEHHRFKKLLDKLHSAY